MSTAAPTNLSELTVAESGVVSGLKGHPSRIQRLAEMGILPGTAVRMIRTAPLGDPIEFELLGYRLSLRRDDARDVQIG